MTFSILKFPYWGVQSSLFSLPCYTCNSEIIMNLLDSIKIDNFRSMMATPRNVTASTGYIVSTFVTRVTT